MTKISERVKNVKQIINSACARAGRDPANVKLVIVTKSGETYGPDMGLFDWIEIFYSVASQKIE